MRVRAGRSSCELSQAVASSFKLLLEVKELLLKFFQLASDSRKLGFKVCHPFVLLANLKRCRFQSWRDFTLLDLDLSGQQMGVTRLLSPRLPRESQHQG